ncbi:hypothetical protein GGR56DRAFT_659716 [Xylariaceae sp. FL0804]|nr:hypothetical protein GGR56DRAFT_659716 [Xylariaceae sp. FL0804]
MPRSGPFIAVHGSSSPLASIFAALVFPARASPASDFRFPPAERSREKREDGSSETSRLHRRASPTSVTVLVFYGTGFRGFAAVPDLGVASVVRIHMLPVPGKIGLKYLHQHTCPCPSPSLGSHIAGGAGNVLPEKPASHTAERVPSHTGTTTMKIFPICFPECSSRSGTV